MITIGNLRLTPKDTVIEIRLNTNTGTALFGYGEVPGLIEALKNLRPPIPVADDDDWKDLV